MRLASRRAMAIAAPAALALLLVNRRLGRRWGTADDEVAATLPGDDVIPAPLWQTTHGITIHSTPADVWPWIVQMGITRGGWYLSARLDRVIWRIDNPSVDRIVPELQHLDIGERVPDSVDGTAHFHVVAIEPERALVLHSRRHPVTGIWPDVSADDPGPYLDFSWTFVLRDMGDGTTRLLMRNRSVVMLGKRPAPAVVKVTLPLLDFFDFLYVRQMLRGIRKRVERTVSGTGTHGGHALVGDSSSFPTR